jgi:hypothetical protein
MPEVNGQKGTRRTEAMHHPTRVLIPTFKEDPVCRDAATDEGADGIPRITHRNRRMARAIRGPVRPDRRRVPGTGRRGGPLCCGPTGGIE